MPPDWFKVFQAPPSAAQTRPSAPVAPMPAGRFVCPELSCLLELFLSLNLGVFTPPFFFKSVLDFQPSKHINYVEPLNKRCDFDFFFCLFCFSNRLEFFLCESCQNDRKRKLVGKAVKLLGRILSPDCAPSLPRRGGAAAPRPPKMRSPAWTPATLWKATILLHVISVALAKRHAVYWNSTNTR